MTKKNFFSYLLLFFFFAMLFFSPHTFQGALNGVKLWLFTVTPTLLPYLIVSAYMTENGTFRYFSTLLSPVTTRLFHLPKDSGYILFLGFFCGYPVGSRLCAEFVKKGYLSKKNGQILLSFCNNPSPAFLLTYLMDYVLGMHGLRFPVLFCILGTPLLLGIVLSRICNRTAPIHEASVPVSEQAVSFDACISNGFETIFRLGGYLVLFSILGEYLSLWIKEPVLLCRIATLTEMTSGLSCYHDANLPAMQKVVEGTCLTTFGGLCCIAQTQGMIKSSGLSLCLYICARIFTSLCSLCLILLFLS